MKSGTLGWMKVGGSPGILFGHDLGQKSRETMKTTCFKWHRDRISEEPRQEHKVPKAAAYLSLLCIGVHHSCLSKSSDLSQLPNTEQFSYLPGPTRNLKCIYFGSSFSTSPSQTREGPHDPHTVILLVAVCYRKGYKVLVAKRKGHWGMSLIRQELARFSLPHRSHIGHVQFPRQQDVAQCVKGVDRGTS